MNLNMVDRVTDKQSPAFELVLSLGALKFETECFINHLDNTIANANLLVKDIRDCLKV